jgi:ribosomal protein L37AE/L43A
MIITDSNRPTCEKCQDQPAFTNISGVWLCGDCATKFIEKEKERKRRIILEEDGMDKKEI